VTHAKPIHSPIALAAALALAVPGAAGAQGMDPAQMQQLLQAMQALQGQSGSGASQADLQRMLGQIQGLGAGNAAQLGGGGGASAYGGGSGASQADLQRLIGQLMQGYQANQAALAGLESETRTSIRDGKRGRSDPRPSMNRGGGQSMEDVVRQVMRTYGLENSGIDPAEIAAQARAISQQMQAERRASGATGDPSMEEVLRHVRRSGAVPGAGAGAGSVDPAQLRQMLRALQSQQSGR